MRMLILGGTGFIGQDFVRAAVDRDHRVSVFSRGKIQADLPSAVEYLTGDRSGDLKSIAHRDWDAVFDLATYVPNSVRNLGKALSGRVDHYTFISTIMAYKFPGATDEDAEVLRYTDSVDPYTVTSPGSQYGALKVLCEQESERYFPGKTLVLRPGHIVGPRERVGAFTYLVARMEKGGEILASGDPKTQVQLIDARDLAEWAIRMAEQRVTGAFNALGPAMSLSWGELLGGVRAAFSAPAKLTWIPVDWLMERQVNPFSSLLFWGSEMGIPGFTQLSNAKAIENGLTFRPLSATVSDTHAWYTSLSDDRRKQAVLACNKGRDLEDCMRCEAQVLAAWHRYQ